MKKYIHVKCPETQMVCSLTLWMKLTPKNLADVLLPFGSYLLDIIGPLLGRVPTSSTCP